MGSRGSPLAWTQQMPVLVSTYDTDFYHWDVTAPQPVDPVCVAWIAFGSVELWRPPQQPDAEWMLLHVLKLNNAAATLTCFQVLSPSCIVVVQEACSLVALTLTLTLTLI